MAAVAEYEFFEQGREVMDSLGIPELPKNYHSTASQ